VTRRVAVVGCRPPRGRHASPEHNAIMLAITDDVQAFMLSLRPGTVVVSGGADGVDKLARLGAALGGFRLVEHMPQYTAGHSFPCDCYGCRYAPLVRNTAIVFDCDELHAWPAPWSKGTIDSIAKARLAGRLGGVHEPWRAGRPGQGGAA
jgi:hypothetical protein